MLCGYGGCGVTVGFVGVRLDLSIFFLHICFRVNLNHALGKSLRDKCTPTAIGAVRAETSRKYNHSLSIPDRQNCDRYYSDT